MKIAIIGGYGKMGRWLASFLKGEGHDVTISGRDEERLRQAAAALGVKSASNTQAAAGAQAVILSVPIDSFEDIAGEIAPYTREGQLVFDVTSVKSQPVEAMHSYFTKCTVLGTHPMFGPGAEDLKGQRVVLTPVGQREEDLAGKVRDWLQAKRAKVTVMSPREHDAAMAVVLGMSHFIALVSADTLTGLGGLEKFKQVGGTSFRLLLTLAQAVVSEDPDFYSSLQLSLPGLAEIEQGFADRAARWASLVREGRKQEFMDAMDGLRRSFENDDPGFASSYREMYRLLRE